MIFDFFHKNSNQQSIPNNSLEERSHPHPQLKRSNEALLNLVENTENEIKNASIAEQKVICQVRQLGQEVLEDWAIQQADRIANEFQTAHPFVKKHGKKKRHWHTTFGKIELKEQLFWRDGHQQRPFSDSAYRNCRGYSLPLQRVITDFGADNSFGKVDNKLKEHYGISLPTSSIQAITEKLSEEIEKIQEFKEEIPEESFVNTLIVETDGRFVPIVTTTETSKASETVVETDGRFVPIVTTTETSKASETDHRKNRNVACSVSRLCLAHPQGSCTPVFGGTIGNPQQICSHLLHTAIEAGINLDCNVHAVGDGASWIIDKIDDVFGTKANYLIDF